MIREINVSEITAAIKEMCIQANHFLSEYLESCRRAALFTAEYSGWITVPCAKDGKPREIEDISNEILERVL